MSIVHSKSNIVVTAVSLGAGADPNDPAGPGPAVRVVAGVAACPRCGLTYAAFRQHGLLGCEACYAAFGEALGALLERAGGAPHHVGKSPRVGADRPTDPAAGRLNPEAPVARSVPTLDPEDRQRRESVLRKQLAEAVAAEQYERAVCLRDELRRLEQSGGGVA